MKAWRDWEIPFARLVVVLASACGILALVAAFSNKEWKMGPEGWLLLGILGAVLALVAIADDRVARN